MFDWIKAFDWGKSIQSMLKYFGAAVLGVLISALIMTYGFKPNGELENLIWVWIVYPSIVALVGWLNNIRKHWQDGMAAKVNAPAK